MDVLSHQARQLLVLANAGQASIRGADWLGQAPPLHRSVYVRASELLISANKVKGASGNSASLPAQSYCAYLLLMGMAWSIVRFGQPVGSDALTVAVARRIKRAYASAASSDASLEEAVDILVENAGRGLFSFDACLLIALRCGIPDFSAFYNLTMGMMEDPEIRRGVLRLNSGLWSSKGKR